MNVQRCRVALRPRGPLASFDVALLVQQALWPEMVRLGALATAPFLVLALLVGPSVAIAVAIPSLSVLQVPALRVAGRALFGEAVPLRDALALPPGLVVVLPVLLALSAGVTLLVGLVPIAAITLFVPEVAVLEGGVGGAVFTRAAAIASRAPGTALAGALLVGGVHLGGLVGGELLGRSILEVLLGIPMPTDAYGEPQLSWAGLVGLLAVTPFSALVRLILYVDARTAAEGWDLQVALLAAGAPR